MLNILLAKIIAAIFDFYSSGSLGRNRDFFNNFHDGQKEGEAKGGEMFINLSPFSPPPTVCSNSKSNIATLIKDREFITATRPNSTHEMQARKVLKC